MRALIKTLIIACIAYALLALFGCATKIETGPFRIRTAGYASSKETPTLLASEKDICYELLRRRIVYGLYALPLNGLTEKERERMSGAAVRFREVMTPADIALSIFGAFVTIITKTAIVEKCTSSHAAISARRGGVGGTYRKNSPIGRIAVDGVIRSSVSSANETATPVLDGLRIFFRYNTTVLAAKSRLEMERSFTRIARMARCSSVLIIGRADTEYGENHEISFFRAQFIKGILVKRGVDPRGILISYSKQNHDMNCGAPELRALGRYRCRRADLVLIGASSSSVKKYSACER